MKFFHPLLTFLFHLNYFGPLVMGVLDSSFLVLPFGNDLVVVGLVAQHRHGHLWLYVLTAALGSTLGAALLAFVARKLGEDRIRKIAGPKRFDRLCGWIHGHGAFSLTAGALAPPPFPYTLVIAAAGALDYPLPRILLVNFLARAARFAILAWLALRFGHQVLAVAQSAAFRWSMVGFILLCLALTAFSLVKWFGRRKNA
jgi:membrane protein YqaA with SNARE-associated domain